MAGAVVCEGGQKCPCFFGFGDAKPGDCPELDKIVLKHEKQHVPESECDPSEGANPHRAKTKDPKKYAQNECQHRRESIADLKDAIKKSSGKCKAAMLGLSAKLRIWVSQNCP